MRKNVERFLRFELLWKVQKFHGQLKYSTFQYTLTFDVELFYTQRIIFI